LVAAALDPWATPATVDKARREVALTRLANQERESQRVEPELLAEFARRVEDGGADACLDLLRPAFTAAADTVTSALATVAVIPDDAETFMNTATGEQLTAWQSLAPAITELEAISVIARVFGPFGAFPVVEDPRTTDPGLRCGWLHDTAVMCTSNALMQACAHSRSPPGRRCPLKPVAAGYPGPTQHRFGT
jgi:hypothetical protein